MGMPFFFATGLAVRLLYRSLFGARGTIARLNRRRRVMLAVMVPAYLLAELLIWASFVLDEIFFRGYRRIAPDAPVFIVGPPRSGTTLLQRLLARDTGTFTSMRLWELLCAPSVTLKQCFRALGAMDRRCGGRLRRALLRREQRLLQDFSRLHALSLFKPEEDELVLLHILSSTFLLFAFPFYDVLYPLLYFDQELPRRQRLRIMGFYRRCVQCHLYVYGPQKRYLAKSPSFCGKIDTLREVFPGALFVLTARTPLETVPSTISLFARLFGLFNAVDAPAAVRDESLDLAARWYVTAVEKLACRTTGECVLIPYQELIRRPAQAVHALYAAFDMPMGPEFQEVLSRECRRMAEYKSSHTYSLESVGLEAGEVYRRCHAVFRICSFAGGRDEDARID